ncbi:MAG: hypothetical protein GX434_17560 [Peptococcaceae bacterium]|nr:hypothetical protein [Peptococcaceae bacterium]
MDGGLRPVLADRQPRSASLNSAFAKSKTDDQGVKTVVIDIPKIDGAKAYEPALPASFLTAGDASKAVEIKTDIAAVTIPGNMLTAADAAAAQNVSLTIAAGDKSKPDADVRAQIGDRPVIELNLKIDGKQTAWSSDSAPVTVTIPYTPTAEELKDPEHITVWYIDGSGKAVSVPSGRYDPATGKVTFSYHPLQPICRSFCAENGNPRRHKACGADQGRHGSDHCQSSLSGQG